MTPPTPDAWAQKKTMRNFLAGLVVGIVLCVFFSEMIHRVCVDNLQPDGGVMTPSNLDAWEHEAAISLCKRWYRTFVNDVPSLMVPEDLAVKGIADALLSAETRGAESERDRAKRYLEKICWSKEDIEAFLKWGSKEAPPSG